MTAQSIAKTKADRYMAQAAEDFEKRAADRRKRFAENPADYYARRKLIGWAGDAPLGVDADAEPDPSTLPGYRQHELHEAIVAAFNELRGQRSELGNRDPRDLYREKHRQVYRDMGFYPPRKIPNWSRSTAFILDTRLR